MDETIKKKNVFIDTSLVESKIFDWKGRSLSSIRGLVHKQLLVLITTDITQREIAARIRDRVWKASEALKELRPKIAVLKSGFDEAHGRVLLEIDPDKTSALLAEAQERFFAECEAVCVAVYEHSSESVFDNYFSGEPPFGPGKKKAEFFDAFVIQALRAWCETHNEEIYVVSLDEGMLAACNGRLIPERNLDIFLDGVNIAMAAPGGLDRLTSLVQSNSSAVVNFLESEFPALGFVLVDQDGDVEDVEVQRVEIEDVLILNNEDGIFSVEIIANVQFTAELHYWDADTASYVEGDTIYLNQVHESIERAEQVRVSAICYFDVSRPEEFRLEDLQLEEPLDIQVSSDRSDPTALK